MRLFDWLYSRLEFCRRAISEEYKRSGWYKAMNIIAWLYLAFGFITAIPTNPILAWSWSSRVIVLLTALLFLLLIAVEAIYRSTTREQNLPFIEVHVPSAFVLETPNNRSVCRVFVYAQVLNHTPYETTVVQFLLSFKVKGKNSVTVTKTLNVAGFEICNASYGVDEDYPYYEVTTLTDCEAMTPLPLRSPLRQGIPLIGWLGFTVRNSVLPYTTHEEGTGHSIGFVGDEGEYIEEEETRTIYEPEFSAIEEITLSVVDGFRQPPWKGIAERINPKGEGVRPAP